MASECSVDVGAQFEEQELANARDRTRDRTLMTPRARGRNKPTAQPPHLRPSLPYAVLWGLAPPHPRRAERYNR